MIVGDSCRYWLCANVGEKIVEIEGWEEYKGMDMDRTGSVRDLWELRVANALSLWMSGLTTKR